MKGSGKLLNILWRDSTVKNLYGGKTMTRSEGLAAKIIDDVCDEVEKQHPEVITHPDESGDPNVSKAMIYGIPYYELEQDIAGLIDSHSENESLNLAGTLTGFQVVKLDAEKSSEDSRYTFSIVRDGVERTYIISWGQLSALHAAAWDVSNVAKTTLGAIEGGTYGDS